MEELGDLPPIIRTRHLGDLELKAFLSFLMGSGRVLLLGIWDGCGRGRILVARRKPGIW